MAEAAKTARGAFSDIGGGAEGMGKRTGMATMEARHGVMLLGEEFGVHLPRALTTFIASIGPIGAAMEAAFPFLAIAVGATLLIEHLEKMREAGEKLTEDQVKFGTAVENAWNALDTKILEAQKEADTLAKNHLGALHIQLELINRQSMAELVHSFEEVAKAGDVVMKELEGHWYTFGKGSEGAKEALDHFQTQYDSLLAQGKGEAASGLLHGTVTQAQQVLQAMRDKEALEHTSQPTDDVSQKGIAAAQLLQRLHVETGLTLTKQIESQQNLVEVLQAQVSSEARIAELKKLQSGNAVTQEHQTVDKSAGELAKKRAEDEDKAERGTLENFKAYEEEKVNATLSGTAARMAALQSAMDDARQLYGEDSAVYIHYQDEKNKAFLESTARQLEEIGRELDAESKAKDDAIKEQIEAGRKAEDEQRRHMLAMSKTKAPKGGADSLKAKQDELKAEYDAQHTELQKELQLTQTMGEAKVAAQRKIHDELAQLDQTYRDQQLEAAAAEAAAEKQYAFDVANKWGQSLLQVAEGHESMARMARRAFESIISASLEAAIMEVTHEKTAQMAHAEAAAAAAWHAMAGIPVVGPALGAAAAAATFAACVAFEGGTDRVPGVGRGDVVPAMLTPGEGVVPGGVMDGLRDVARNGGFKQQGPTYHVTMRPTYHVNTIDGDGMQDALEKHTDQLQRQMERSLRRMNM